MKKNLFYTIISLIGVTVGSSSCTCSARKDGTQQDEEKAQAALIDTLKADTQRLIDLASSLNPAPFIEKDAKGALNLTEKEKMVKPDYLTNPSEVHSFTGLSQKYRAVGVLGVDRIIADLYEMRIVDYDDAILSVATDLHDGAISQFIEKRHFCGDDLSVLINGEYAVGRGKFAWEFLAASLIEQLYVLSMNIDKLLPMFDESNVVKFSGNLAAVHKAFDSLCETNEDLIPLRDAMLPLYAINAANVEELHSQLIETKGAIELSRLYLFK